MRVLKRLSDEEVEEGKGETLQLTVGRFEVLRWAIGGASFKAGPPPPPPRGLITSTAFMWNVDESERLSSIARRWCENNINLSLWNYILESSQRLSTQYYDNRHKNVFMRVN